MNPSFTPDTRTAGQIALTPEALFELLKEHDILRENSQKNFNVYPRAFRDKFAAVIDSLPRVTAYMVFQALSRNIAFDKDQDYPQKIADELNSLLQSTPPTEPTKDTRRIDWLDQHCAFVADSQFNIGPYKIGELRKMADDGIAQSARLTEPAKPEQEWEERTGVHAKHEGWKRSQCQFRWKHSDSWETIRTENDPQDEDGFYPQCFYRRPRPPQSPKDLEAKGKVEETPETDRLDKVLRNACVSCGLDLSSLGIVSEILEKFRQLERSRDAERERVGALEGANKAHDEVKNLRADKADLTAKLKAAEETTIKSRQGVQDMAEQNAAMKATISRLEGELKDEKQDANTRFEEYRKELASMKSQPCGRLTVADVGLVLGWQIEHPQTEIITKQLNSRLAPSWTPISTPPKLEDADRHGKVVWYTKDGDRLVWHPWNSETMLADTRNITHWRHTNLPAKSVESNFVKWLESKGIPMQMSAVEYLRLHREHDAALTTKGTAP